MTKFMIALTVGASALAFAPQEAAATECTENYNKCLNDTWQYTGFTQVLADVECFAEYVGCVGDKVVIA